LEHIEEYPAAHSLSPMQIAKSMVLWLRGTLPDQADAILRGSRPSRANFKTGRRARGLTPD